MKVTSQNSTLGSASGPGRASETQRYQSGGAGAGATAGDGGDSVQFSSALGGLSRAMESYSSSRTSQVQALASLYRSGNYAIDSSAVSRSMISDALGG